MAQGPIKLPRLRPNWKEQPFLFERAWDEAMKAIELLLSERTPPPP